jgi:F0F1-type ATP synthase assembly protein I
MNDDPSSSGSSRPWLRFVGLGLELATFTLLFTGIGYWVDSGRQHETPYATAAGALIGFVLGMIRFVFQVRKRIDPR